MSTSKTYYIAGPMSYVPQFNVPLFDKVAAELRNKGYTIISPAELDSSKMRAWALQSPDGNPANVKEETGETWGDVLARDVRLVADGIDGIIFLPNWNKSRGAKLEAFVGLLCKKEFYLYDPQYLMKLDPVDVLSTIYRSMV